MSPDEITAFIEANPNVAVQAERAIEDVSVIHEFRHFHDCFGTLGGIALFGSYLDPSFA